MKIKNHRFVVTDIYIYVEFYKKEFGFHVIMDFGVKNYDRRFGIAILDIWREFIGTDDAFLTTMVPKFILKKMILINLLILLKM